MNNTDINVRLWYEKFSYINFKYRVILVLAALHYEKKISDEKLKGQFNSLRKGNFQGVKNTYHCGITNTWHNDASCYDIFLECIESKGLKIIPFQELIKYIQFFENKNYNYALNVFGTEYIYPIFEEWYPEYNPNFSDYMQFHIPNVKAIDESYTCYECGHKHNNYSKNATENLEIISHWLHNMKKGNLKKIPFHSL